MRFNESAEIDFMMSSGKYHPDFYQAVWGLLDNRVGIDRINPVFDICFSLVGKKMTRHPARTTLMDMSVSRVSASQLQVTEVIYVAHFSFKRGEGENLCLYFYPVYDRQHDDARTDG